MELDSRAFDASLRAASARLEAKSEANVKAAGEFMKQRAEARTPVQTGRLRGGFELHEDRQVVGLEVALINTVPYAGFVEFGTSHAPAHPFMRPAQQETRTAAHSLFLRIR